MVLIRSTTAAVILLVLSFMAFARSSVYHDEVTLYADAAAKSPGKARPHNNLGDALKKAGRTDEAMAQFQRALAINPDYPDALNNLATLYSYHGRRSEALDLLQRTLALNPGHIQAHYNLAIQYYEMGLTAEAEREYNFMIQLSPWSKEADFARKMVALIQRSKARNP